MLISGALHDSRGALFPALKSIGLSDEETPSAHMLRAFILSTDDSVLSYLHQRAYKELGQETYADYCRRLSEDW